jgi:hypothetical protein
VDGERREGIKTIAIVVIAPFCAFAIFFASLMGLYDVVYSINANLIKKGILGWLAGATLLLAFGPVMVFAGAADEERNRRLLPYALVVIGGILSTVMLALATTGVFWAVSGYPSAPPMGPLVGAVPIPVSSAFLGLSVGLGLVCTLLLYGLGRWGRSTNEKPYRSSRHLSPDSDKAAHIRRTWVLPPSAWGAVVAVGTFCGFLVGLYTKYIILQLLFAVVAAVITGLFAIRQLKNNQ